MISKQQAIDRLRSEGYHISKNRFTPSYFKSLNFKISTLFDVGVNKGTPNLYAAFENAKMVLIDPQEMELSNLEDWQKEKYNFEFIHKALGNKHEKKIFFRSDISARSSFLRRNDLRKKKELFEEKEVDIITLDSLVTEDRYNGPYGIKLDIEGYELKALEGASRALKNTEFIILESSVKPRFEGGVSFSDLVCFLKDNEFELYDILTPLIKAPTVIDCLFVKKNSALMRL